MKKAILFFALAIASLYAQAQTVVSIVAQSCNVALTACTLQGDGGQVITINPQTVQMTVDGTAYSGAVTSNVVIQYCPPAPQVCYRRSYDVTMTFSPTAQMAAVYSSVRSGSGRGGYAWHQHWVFETLTLY